MERICKDMLFCNILDHVMNAPPSVHLLLLLFTSLRVSSSAGPSRPLKGRHKMIGMAQRLINLEIQVLVRSLKSSNVELG